MTTALVVLAILFGVTALVALAYHLGTRAGLRHSDPDAFDFDDADNGCICGLGECDPRCPACPPVDAERMVN